VIALDRPEIMRAKPLSVEVGGANARNVCPDPVGHLGLLRRGADKPGEVDPGADTNFATAGM